MCKQADARRPVYLRGGVVMAWMAGTGIFVMLMVLNGWGAAQAESQELSAVSRQDTQAEFLSACTILPEVFPAPVLSQSSVSPVRGGELRLQPTIEDYFDAPEINSTLWISGYSNDGYPDVPSPQSIGGVLRLDANYLRAQQPFGAEMPVRFFEASARFVTSPYPVAYADIGFYRSMPPLRAMTETSSIRLFVGQTVIESELPGHMYVRSKDGLFSPSAPPTKDAIDTLVGNWGESQAEQMAALDQFHTYAIHWDQSETNYLIDGSPIITTPLGLSKPTPHAGISTLPTYVFLYSQDPTFFGGGRSPLLVDWVRAGAYPAQGSYTSCIQDAGEAVNWSRITLSASVPAESGVVVESRTSQDGMAWSDWNATSAVASGVTVLSMTNPSGRYFQYRVIFSTMNPAITPEVEMVESGYFGAQVVQVTPAATFITPGDVFSFQATVLDANGEKMVAYPTPVAWSVVNGGGTIDSKGQFTAGFTPGNFVDTVMAAIPGLKPGNATVTVGNAPLATVQVCCEGKEGVPLLLSAAVEPNPEHPPLYFQWDLNNNGEYNDATGATVEYTFPQEGDYPVAVLVTNSLGFTNTARTSVTVLNVAPQITAVNTNSPVAPGAEVTVEVLATDVPGDLLLYSFDWNDDGEFDVIAQPSNRALRVFDAIGEHNIRVRVQDDGGGEALATVAVRVEQHRVFMPLTLRQIE